MYDHVTVRVPDLAAAERRFQTLLDPLAFDETHSTRAIAMWGDFAVAQAEDTATVTRRAHVAFMARSREAVDAFWQAGLTAGLTGDEPPGDGEEGYAAVLRDEHDNRFAAVDGAAGRRDGHVGHVALRVADLDAALAFYEGVAAAAGFTLHRAGAERAIFAGRAAGGLLSLVPGSATEHLHLAFPGDAGAVRRFYASAVEAGHRPNGEPGERARYHAGYFAAYVLDPDGNNIEVVDHQEVTPA